MKITLCGSAKFEKWFHLWNEILTLSGHTVYGLSVYPSTKRGKKNWYTDEEKRLFDEAHLRKIEASDAIFVLNPFAYLGESTLREIEFAKQVESKGKIGKKLFALQSWGIGCGVTGLHFKSVQDAALRAGVPPRFGSPIKTNYPSFRSPWDLLPEAGQFRSSLVDKIHKFNRKYEGSED